MTRYVLIYNPVSGRGGLPRRLDAVLAALHGAIVMPRRTTVGNAGLAEFVREADPDGVLVAGGDGTLSEVVATLAGAGLDLPVGVLPGGTSNDFARYLGVRGLGHVTGGRTRRVDLGRVNGRLFVNVVAAGVMTGAAHGVPVAVKHTVGKLAYYVRGFAELPRIRPLPLAITADGRRLDLEAYFFIVANSSVVGGLRNAAPLARIDDGRLDLVALRRCSPADFLALARRAFAGRLDPGDPRIAYVQAREIAIACALPAESDVDGEPGPGFPLAISAVPGALTIYDSN